MVEGEREQSVHSDTYAVGGVLNQITEYGCISAHMYQKVLFNLAEKC